MKKKGFILMLAVIFVLQSSAVSASSVPALDYNVMTTNTVFDISDTGEAFVYMNYRGYSDITAGAEITIQLERQNFFFIWQPILENTISISGENYKDIISYQLDKTGTYRCTVTYVIQGINTPDDVITYQGEDICTSCISPSKSEEKNPHDEVLEKLAWDTAIKDGYFCQKHPERTVGKVTALRSKEDYIHLYYCTLCDDFLGYEVCPTNAKDCKVCDRSLHSTEQYQHIWDGAYGTKSEYMMKTLDSEYHVYKCPRGVCNVRYLQKHLYDRKGKCVLCGYQDDQ